LLGGCYSWWMCKSLWNHFHVFSLGKTWPISHFSFIVCERFHPHLSPVWSSVVFTLICHQFDPVLFSPSFVTSLIQCRFHPHLSPVWSSVVFTLICHQFDPVSFSPSFVTSLIQCRFHPHLSPVWSSVVFTLICHQFDPVSFSPSFVTSLIQCWWKCWSLMTEQQISRFSRFSNIFFLHGDCSHCCEETVSDWKMIRKLQLIFCDVSNAVWYLPSDDNSCCYVI